MIKPGDYILYRRRNSEHYELGLVKTRNNTNTGWFVRYSLGDTAANTPDDCIIELANSDYLPHPKCGELRGDVYETLDGTSDDIEAWCEYCDIPLDKDWVFCPKCGRLIREEVL